MEQVSALSPDVTLYAARNGYTVALFHRRPHDQGPPEIFDVNEAGKEVLSLVDGCRGTDDIASQLCEKHGLDLSENFDWIESFLKEMSERRVIVPGGRTANSELVVIGDSTHLWPSHVTIEVTETCNLTCQHCYLEASPQNRTRISIEDFRQLVADLVRRHVLTVELTGGEFFMHPDALEILEMSYARFAKVGILTNGTHFPDRALELMADNADRTVVGVSLDSARAELHDRWRGGRGAFAKTCANVKRLADRGIAVRIGVTIFDENRWELEEMARLSVSLGARMFGFSFVEDSGRGESRREDQRIRFDPEYEAYVAAVIVKYKDIIPIVPAEDARGASGNCGAGSRAMTIGADGCLRPCTLFPRSLVIGNALRGGWDDVADLSLPNRLASVPIPNLENGCGSDCPFLLQCWGCYLKGLRANVGKPPSEYCSWVLGNELGDLVETSAPRRSGAVPVKLTRR